MAAAFVSTTQSLIVPTTQHRENTWDTVDKNVTHIVILIGAVATPAGTVTATIVAVVMTVTGIGTPMVVIAVVVIGAIVIVVARLHAGATHLIMVGAAVVGVILAVLLEAVAPPEVGVVEVVAILILPPRHLPLQLATNGKSTLVARAKISSSTFFFIFTHFTEW